MAPTFSEPAKAEMAERKKREIRLEGGRQTDQGTGIGRGRAGQSIQDCEAAFRRVADPNLSATAVPTVAPIFATPMPSPDDGECSTYEDLAAALT